MSDEDGLTYFKLMQMPIMKVVGIITGNFCAADKVKAASALHARATKFKKTSEYLAMSLQDKTRFTAALNFDTSPLLGVS